MEKGSTGATEKTQSALPCKDESDEDSSGPNSLNSEEATCGATAGRARWTLLRQVLCQKQTDSPEVKQVSVRRFATFDLFRRKKLSAQEHCDTSDDQWVEYRSVYYPEYGAFLRDNLGPLKVNEVLNSFDNTGNVCVWPSEEVMAHYCLQKRHTFKGAVCELGGGMTCLGGLMVAISADVKEVLLSDGNEKSIQNVRRVVECNRQAGKFGSTHVSSRLCLLSSPRRQRGRRPRCDCARGWRGRGMSRDVVCTLMHTCERCVLGLPTWERERKAKWRGKTGEEESLALRGGQNSSSGLEVDFSGTENCSGIRMNRVSLSTSLPLRAILTKQVVGIFTLT
ncbi:calmodulin-lysine N-methyltransferase isoform X2 [Poeciliopsis prolifica]|uniref:calmodulin-lysine N-methyltransferase isoform X2 n=1 Tax=Poeciliopsis prolifica TaxID=188132 RepID=UPI0024134C4E|nr:calmodulin-lysine N-methyltransferase isoform X2 [Poeciliopsis prolifica]